MIINEKGLAKLLADEYRSCGYCVWTDGYTMWLRGGGWLAGIDTDRVPGKILGMLAEHLCCLPGKGEAYRVTKAKGGPYIQLESKEYVAEIVATMEETARLGLDEDHRTAVRPTKLTCNGFQIWQALPDCAIMQIDPRYAAAIEDPMKVFRIGNGIYGADTQSRLWIFAERESEPESGQMRHLSQLRWVQ